MNSVSTQTRRWHHIGFITLFGTLISGMLLFVLWTNAYAAFRVGGAGNCGNFADAILLAEDEDIIAQMAPSNNSGSPVITKNLRLSGGWLPSVNCEENNQYFTNTTNYLDYGFLYGAPYTRSELFPSGDSVLTLEDPLAPSFPNLDKLIIEHFILGDAFGSDGGGINGVISGSAEVLLDNVWFQNNEVFGDGAGLKLEVHGGSHLTIEDSAFLTNTAGVYGGGLYVELHEGSSLTIEDSTFFANTTNSYGGGLYVELREGSYLTIENTLLNDNDALFGGGMHLVVYDTSQVYIKNSQFSANTTYSSNGWGGGGQIIMHGGQVILDGATFDGNFAGGDAGGLGGGLFIQMDAGEVIIKNSHFANNSAGGGGGGLFVDSVGNEPAHVKIINTRFENNSPNPYQFLQTGSGALNTLILDQSVYLPIIQKSANPSVATVRINQITLDNSFNFVVDYDTFNFTPALPGVHLHFFFDTVSPENAGMPGSGPWKIYGGSSPYTGYSFDERPFGPYGAEKLCVLVANADHTVRQGTGNCVKLP